MATLLEFVLALYPGLQNNNFGIWNELLVVCFFVIGYLVVAFYLTNILNSVERGSELVYKCNYHGLRNPVSEVLRVMFIQCFISGALVYILRCFHLYSFESYDRLFTL